MPSKIPTSEKESVWMSRELKPMIDFLKGDTLCSWSASASEWLSLTTLLSITPICALLLIAPMIFRNSIRVGTKFFYQWAKFSQMMFWKARTTYEKRAWSTQTVLGLYEMEIHQRVSKVKRTPDQEFKSRNYQARNGSRQEQRWMIAGAKAVLMNDEEKFYQWRAAGQCSKGDNCSFRHDVKQSGKSTPKSLVLLSRRKMVRKFENHRLEYDWDVY